jgi:hypothetical protein
VRRQRPVRADHSKPGRGGSSVAAPPVAQDGKPRRKQGTPLVGPGNGRWHEPRTNTTQADLTDEQREQIEVLEAIGYTDGVHDAGSLAGVTRRDDTAIQPGLNLLTSAHEPSALLIDSRGEVLHGWRYGFRRVWPDYPGVHRHRSFWRRTHLFDDGSLLAIYEGLGIIKLDVNSNLLWKSSVRAHHAMQPMPDGTLWVLTREARVVPRVDPVKPILEDFISLLGPDGQELRRISVLDALENSEFAHYWDGKLGPGKGGDIFHTNSLAVLDESHAHLGPEFAEGNFLVSMLILDLLAIIDSQSGTVVWAMQGAFNRQHDPQILPTGKLMIFDNNMRDGASRVVELDPITGEETWVYEGSDSEPFYSETCGVAQRLPNGNTLITESDYGRAFEITSNGDTVWEYYNPFRAGDEGQYIATMMEMRRLPADFAPAWLEEGSDGR